MILSTRWFVLYALPKHDFIILRNFHKGLHEQM